MVVAPPLRASKVKLKVLTSRFIKATCVAPAHHCHSKLRMIRRQITGFHCCGDTCIFVFFLIPRMERLYCIFVLVLSVASFTSSAQAPSQKLNVLDYGAVGDGVTDDSKAFMKAWKEACGADSDNVDIIIPKTKTFMLSHVLFLGPCRPRSIHVKVQGNIVAPPRRGTIAYYMGSWIAFARVNRLRVDGDGQIDGRGANWWKSCGRGDNCRRPTALKFDNCYKLQLDGLKLINTPKASISISNCDHSIISNINISTPATSPETDGMDITHSANVQVRDCNFRTGDDCIALLSGSSNINITGVKCGPGHGISIGSMGHNGDYDTVENVYVKDCSFTTSTNGVRIKTWQGGKGYVKNVNYEDITFSNTSNPIIIDQYYCPHRKCANQTDAVAVSNISYKGLRGTSFTKVAIDLSCSQTVKCKGITLEDVKIISAVPTQKVISRRFNAIGKSSHTSPPVF